MSGTQGTIPGGSVMERAVALAGCLAELSQTRLVLHVLSAEVELSARITNLPGVLAEEVARRGEVRVGAPAIGADFVLTASGGRWECGDTSAAALLRAKLHA